MALCVCVCVCVCVSARAPCCVVSADVTAGTALSRGVSKSWDRSSGERERGGERERERERETRGEREEGRGKLNGHFIGFISEH